MAFGIPTEQAIIKELNKKYANRVMFDLGLAICVHDLIKASEGVVHYGDGFFWYTGALSVRPVPRELIETTVCSEFYSDFSSHRISTFCKRGAHCEGQVFVCRGDTAYAVP